MYERLGRWMWSRYQHRWGLVLALVFAGIFCIVLMVPSTINMALTYDLSSGQALAVLAFLVAVGAPVHLIGFLVASQSQRRAIAAWVEGDRSDPDAVRQASLYMVGDFVPRLLSRLGPPLILIVCGTIAWWVDGGWTDALAISLQATGVIIADVIFTIVSFELLFRPLREEVDAAAPARPEGRGFTVVGRLRTGGTLVAWATGVIVPPYVVQVDSPAARLTTAAAVSAVFAVLFGLGAFGALIVTPVVRPLDDLLRGTRRVRAGVYDVRLPLTTDDEFGELITSFNAMQSGLLERERLHAAFGSYVDPALAQRLMEQGDDLFAGEEVEVTVFFADVRDFTPYAESATPREAVERLNRLFSLVVPILREHHGHANKFLGDGVLAVFGVPEPIEDHAAQALAAACAIQDRVAAEFAGELRLGIGINTGRVLAGTIGGGGKLEFTLIGDAVNVAARVEERTKAMGDAVLLTSSTLAALPSRPAGLVDRGEHELKGKASRTRLYAVAGAEPQASS